jgi:hypothetical protein
MRLIKVLIVALYVCLAGTYADAATRTSIATDDFNRASLGANWAQNGDSGWGVVDTDGSSKVYGTEAAGASVRSAARWIGAGTFTDNQYASVVISGLTSIGSNVNTIGAGCRMSGADGTRTFYYIWLEDLSDNADFGKFVNGTRTSFTTGSITIVNGDRIELECDGTTITAMINGVAIGGSFTTTDSSIATGTPGVIASGNNTGALVGDDWDGGNLSGVTARRRMSPMVFH